MKQMQLVGVAAGAATAAEESEKEKEDDSPLQHPSVLFPTHNVPSFCNTIGKRWKAQRSAFWTIGSVSWLYWAHEFPFRCLRDIV